MEQTTIKRYAIETIEKTDSYYPDSKASFVVREVTIRSMHYTDSQVITIGRKIAYCHSIADAVTLCEALNKTSTKGAE